jgi:hypothetical protein
MSPRSESDARALAASLLLRSSDSQSSLPIRPSAAALAEPSHQSESHDLSNTATVPVTPPDKNALDSHSSFNASPLVHKPSQATIASVGSSSSAHDESRRAPNKGAWATMKRFSSFSKSSGSVYSVLEEDKSGSDSSVRATE